MNRIDEILSKNKKALMPFLVAGFPSIETTEGAIIAMDEAGADIIEIGIPFSDPIADGPVIAAAMHEALNNGVVPNDAIDLTANIREQVSAGLIAMVSDSIVRKSGGTLFLDRLAQAGFDGIIIPDIDDLDAAAMSTHCKHCGLSFSMLVSPTTPLDRISWLASISTGFLYILARVGLTGEQSAPPDISSRIDEIRSVTNLPLAVGFGISTRDHVSNVTKSADAAIVGSALVRRMSDAKDPVLAAREFVRELS
jgi:tryptophan synthase alpha chain